MKLLNGENNENILIYENFDEVLTNATHSLETQPVNL
jgi:hypothetical protein